MMSTPHTLDTAKVDKLKARFDSFREKESERRDARAAKLRDAMAQREDSKKRDRGLGD